MGEDVNGTTIMKPAATTYSKPPHFVLIHGIGGGGWCWYRIKCLLEKSGYKVCCLDLKSAGIDISDANTILSFEHYNQPLIDFMSALPDDEQVILVGHSAGGLSITAATHMFPKKIRLAVYLGATMLKSGYWTQQDVKDGVPDLSDFGDVYDLGFGLGLDKPPTSALVKKEFQRKIIFQLSPLEDCALAAMLLRPGPMQALQSAQFTESDEIEKVPRVYIKTMHDHVLKPEQQEAMIKRWPPANVFVLESDHSPFFSTPSVLFDLLIEALSSIEHN